MMGKMFKCDCGLRDCKATIRVSQGDALTRIGIADGNGNVNEVLLREGQVASLANEILEHHSNNGSVCNAGSQDEKFADALLTIAGAMTPVLDINNPLRDGARLPCADTTGDELYIAKYYGPAGPVIVGAYAENDNSIVLNSKDAVKAAVALLQLVGG